MVVKGKQSPSIASKGSGKQSAGSKADKGDRSMSDAATEASQATSLSSQASPSKGKQSSSEASCSSSAASKDSVSTHSEQQADVEKPKPQPAASKEADQATDAADDAKAASSSKPEEVSQAVGACGWHASLQLPQQTGVLMDNQCLTSAVIVALQGENKKEAPKAKDAPKPAKPAWVKVGAAQHRPQQGTHAFSWPAGELLCHRRSPV